MLATPGGKSRISLRAIGRWYDQPAGEYHPMLMYSNPNLLLNGDFQVWQRGTEFSNIITNEYTVDGWRILGDSANKMEIKKAPHGAYVAGTLCAWIEGNLEGETVTFSANIDGTLLSQTMLVKSGWKGYDIPFADKKISISTQVVNNNTKLEIYLYNVGKTAHNVKYCKLEYGAVATSNYPRSYEEELLRCQRRYVMLRDVYAGRYWKNLYLGFAFPVEMRIKPIIAYKFCLLYTSDAADEL